MGDTEGLTGLRHLVPASSQGMVRSGGDVDEERMDRFESRFARQVLRALGMSTNAIRLRAASARNECLDFMSIQDDIPMPLVFRFAEVPKYDALTLLSTPTKMPAWAEYQKIEDDGAVLVFASARMTGGYFAIHCCDTLVKKSRVHVVVRVRGVTYYIQTWVEVMAAFKEWVDDLGA